MGQAKKKLSVIGAVLDGKLLEPIQVTGTIQEGCIIRFAVSLPDSPLADMWMRYAIRAQDVDR